MNHSAASSAPALNTWPSPSARAFLICSRVRGRRVSASCAKKVAVPGHRRVFPALRGEGVDGEAEFASSGVSVGPEATYPPLGALARSAFPYPAPRYPIASFTAVVS
jgi:hypothetical protein